MNSVKIYQAFRDLGFNEEKANDVVKALEERDSYAATKGDLKDLEIKMLEAIRHQTHIYLGGLAVLGIVFKVAEILINKFS